MDEFEQFKATFFAECNELLGDLESELGGLVAGDADVETLNSIFRAVHSIKAGAGAFKFAALVTFAHAFEALLDRLRTFDIQVSEPVLATLFRSNDVLAVLVEDAQNGRETSADFGEDVLAELQALMAGDAPSPAAPPETPPEAPPEADDARPQAGAQTFRVSFTPKPELFQHANEPLLIVRELQTLGAVRATADLSRLPALSAIDPEGAYLAWTFEVATAAGVEGIEEAFEFVGDDCDLEITALDAAPAADPPDAIVEDAGDAGSVAAASDEDVPAEIASTASAAPAGKPSAAKAAAAPAAASRAGQMSSIRVDLDRIDRLVNMVGEIVITQSMLSQQTNDLQMEQFATVVRGLEELALHTRELQESVMAIRMQPVKSVFARMPRLVRDLSAKLGKNVRLDVFGENTEVDTTVVEEISDPITHMIRNSLDHGLETAEARVAAGKPPQGVIRLSAEHRSGRIVIAIEDDGRGIDRERVLAKARERGIVQAEQALTDEEIDNLIFAPGFSTAQAVTDVSGRGVGMDVVRRNVQALGGRVGIQNHPGKGTRFTMTLPLTLAVMDGMIVAAGGEKYVVPITAIVECMRPQKTALSRLPSGMELVHVRGEYIPLIYLARAFDLDGAILDPSEALVVLVDSDEKGRVGIVVDELLGQQQVVIKSLESNYDPVAGLSGATILGNGRVAPILDVEGLCGIAAGVRSGAIRQLMEEAAA